MLTVDERFPDRRICVMGLGYVGLTLAAVLADVGFKVLGVEIREDVVDGLKKGRPHFFEPGLADLIKRLVEQKRIKFANRIPSDSQSSVYVITVGTPLDARGKVRLDMVENTAKEVGRHLKKGDLVVLRSTTKIGMTRKRVMPLLAKSGVDFDLAFCPERTLEGRALPELRQLPQIVGGLNFKSAVRAAQIFQFLTPTVIRVNDIESAEIIKLIDNTYRDVTFAFANEIADICDRLGISAIEVIRAGKLGYPRTNLPVPGLVGGPCLEKDPYILAERLRELGYEPQIAVTARRINERQPVEAVDFIVEKARGWKGFPKNPVVSLMGLAFKGRPATDDLRGTLARPIFKALKRHLPKAQFRGFDPMVSKAALEAFGVRPVRSIEAAFKGAHLVFIMNNHEDFAHMPIEILADTMARPGVIYDYWNTFTATSLNFPKGVGYAALGSHGQAVWPHR